jgi:hypothetical protein
MDAQWPAALWGEDRMSLYQVSTRASRRRRIGAWLRARWNRRVRTGRHHQTGDVPSRYAYVPRVVQHPPVPLGKSSSADMLEADVRDAPAAADRPLTTAMPKVPQQRPASRTPSVYPNAYRAR